MSPDERRRDLHLQATAKCQAASHEFLRVARGEIDDVMDGLMYLFEAPACLSVADQQTDPSNHRRRMDERIRRAVATCELPEPVTLGADRSGRSH